MISLLIVNYRSAALTIAAIESARAATTAPLQIVIVDNSCDPAEAESLANAGDILIVSSSNRGYAGAINDGRRRCDGDVIIVSNPDVKFAAGSIDALASALNDDVVVAGPALFWDDAFTWMLPPSELHTAREKIDQVLASRSRKYHETRDRRRFATRVSFWSATKSRAIGAISGAVMAIRANVFDELEGFDERFQLYFEENDFLRRVAHRRKRIMYVPVARCRHIYNQSAARSDDAASMYAESEARYLAKWNGPFVARALKRFERELPHDEAQRIDGAIDLDRDGVVVEASPLASFSTAAGHFPTSRRVDLPDEVLQTYAGDVVYIRVVERDTGRVLTTYARMI